MLRSSGNAVELGAPVVASPILGAVRVLVGAVAGGARPGPAVLAFLGGSAQGGAVESVAAVAPWMGVGDRARGRALWELLLLADAVGGASGTGVAAGRRKATGGLRFPGVRPAA